MSPSWTRRMGLSIYTSPLMSHLSVPPEVFLYGEGVLNRWTSLQKQKQSSIATATSGGKKRPSSSSSFCTHASSYAVLEAPRDGLNSFPPSESLALSDLYPLLLALRVGVDRSQGEQLYTTSALPLHYLFTISALPLHYLCPISTLSLPYLYTTSTCIASTSS